MSLHKLVPGKQLISDLLDLAAALGYHAKAEWPLDKNVSTGAAVDVAWFAEAGDIYPLMVFEVESGATTGMSNNALKFFSKSNEELLKPLFYFHVIVRALEGNERIESLRKLFGSHNYRLYIASENQLQELLADVFAQHRRIRARLRLREVLHRIEKWEAIDLNDFLKNIEELNFTADFLQIYAERAGGSALFRQRFLELLGRLACERVPSVLRLQQYDRPYFGHEWVYPIHLGIIAGHNPSLTEAMLGLLKYWQLRSSFMTQIGPHFGLNQDYDIFVLCHSASLWGLLAGLFAHNNAREFICDQMKAILDETYKMPVGIQVFLSLWMLHVSGSASLETVFRHVSRLIESYGISEELLFAPPAYIDWNDPDAWMEAGSGRSRIGTLDDFASVARSRFSLSPIGQLEAVDVAVAILAGGVIEDWPTQLLGSLWRQS